MTKNNDDLEAVRNVVTALEGFDPNDQERIIRWAKEKLGLASGNLEGLPTQTSPPTTQQHHHIGQPYTKLKTDIKTFVDTKDPKSDMYFAATIAYYYRFEASLDQRKEEISSGHLQEACRQVGRRRLKNPGQTLINAHYHGLLDRSETGSYSINTVGENLVAMTLPVSGNAGTAVRSRSKPPAKKKVPQERKQAKTSKQPAKKSSI